MRYSKGESVRRCICCSQTQGSDGLLSKSSCVTLCPSDFLLGSAILKTFCNFLFLADVTPLFECIPHTRFTLWFLCAIFIKYELSMFKSSASVCTLHDMQSLMTTGYESLTFYYSPWVTDFFLLSDFIFLLPVSAFFSRIRHEFVISS